jgi:hypothetical protein
MSQASVQALLSKILITNISPPSIAMLKSTTNLVNNIAATVLRHQQFCSNILMALSKSELQHHVENFLRIDPSDFEEHHNTSCRSADVVIRQTCLSATISMLLTALFAGHDQTSRVPSSFGFTLIKKQRQLSMPTHQCTHKTEAQVSGRRSG